jgi:hypothetical protein
MKKESGQGMDRPLKFYGSKEVARAAVKMALTADRNE